MNGKILITARSFRKTPGRHQDILREAGYELIESPHDRPLTAAEIAPLLADVDAAILGLDEVTAESVAGASRLRVISRYGVGVDSIDIAAMTARGIVVTVTPGANSVAVAELTMGLILAVARHIPYADREVRQGHWGRKTGVELSGSTLGLIGLGRIGRDVARRAYAFGMTIGYYDPFPPPPEAMTGFQARARSLDELLAESDFVSLHLPLTEETRNLIDARALARMKPTACLINTARGGLVDEQALYEALAGGRLAGAAFDAFAQEPPGDSPLLKLDNFVASPHAGSATAQTTLRMGLLASENALAVLRGECPEGVVNPDVFSRD